MKSFFSKFKKFYESINLTTKSLIIIGLICLFETVITVFFDTHQTSPNDIAVRSVMSSIFGFIFGSQLSENSNMENRNIQTLIAFVVSMVCLITIIAGHWLHAKQDGAALVEIRNLLFSAVGFMLSRAKHPN
jgi:ABC-type cobalamin transport system permease subunit